MGYDLGLRRPGLGVAAGGKLSLACGPSGLTS